jgi:hypothetical protein
VKIYKIEKIISGMAASEAWWQWETHRAIGYPICAMCRHNKGVQNLVVRSPGNVNAIFDNVLGYKLLSMKLTLSC